MGLKNLHVSDPNSKDVPAYMRKQIEDWVAQGRVTVCTPSRHNQTALSYSRGGRGADFTKLSVKE